MKYSQEYENSLHFSPRFQEYAKSLAQRLIDDHKLLNKDIVEIGCGKGDFLKILCQLGQNRGMGFDPSFETERIGDLQEDSFKVIQDFYSERYADYAADIICCRHVLEHIQLPKDFIKTIRQTVGSRLNTVVFFEVPNVMFTLKDLGIWDLIYEHCGYFSMGSLSYLFNTCGFKQIKLMDVFEGQFLCIDAIPLPDSSEIRVNRWDDHEEMASDVSLFSQRYYDKVTEWQRNLENMKKDGRYAVIWGAGSKGVTFLNTLKVQGKIRYVVDINPHKHGKHVPGTGQKIVPPEFLRENQPDTVIVMNPIYIEEIQHLLAEMEVSSKVIAV
jgi:SAM-dependent methyltransferase